MRKDVIQTRNIEHARHAQPATDFSPAAFASLLIPRVTLFHLLSLMCLLIRLLLVGVPHC